MFNVSFQLDDVELDLVCRVLVDKIDTMLCYKDQGVSPTFYFEKKWSSLDDRKVDRLRVIANYLLKSLEDADKAFIEDQYEEEDPANAQA